MPEGGGARWVLAGAVAAIAALPLDAASASAAEQRPGSVEAISSKALSVSVEKRGTLKQGRLSLPITVRRTGGLSVEFRLLGSGRAVLVDPKAKTPKKGLAIRGRLPTGDLHAGDTRVLQLLFLLPGKGKAEALNGVIHVRTGGGKPYVSRVEGKTDAPDAKPRFSFTQDKLTVDATRHVPWSGVDTKRTIGLRDATPKKKVGKEDLASTLLTLEGSGTVSLKLEPADKAKGDIRPATLAISDGDGTGSATGKLQLTEKGTNQALDLTVRTQDFVGWPFMVVLLGALVGGPLTVRVSQRNRAKQVRQQVRDAVKAYDEAEPTPPGVPEPESIADVVGSSRDWLGWKAVWPLSKFYEQPTEGAAALYRSLGPLRVPNAEELERHATQAQALVERIENWLELRTALAQLAAAVKQAAPSDSLSRPLYDGQEMLQEPHPVPKTAALGVEATERIQGQAAALRLLALAVPLWKQVRQHADKLDDYELWRLRRSDPVKTYDAYGYSGQRRPEQTAHLLTHLQEVANEVLFLHTKLDEVTPYGAIITSLQMIDMTSGVVHLTGLARDVLNAFAQELGDHRKRVPTMESVLAGMRRWDWVLFLASLGVSALAYLLPVYSGHSFGTWEQYATAFAAGFVGTGIVNLALLPLTRTYRGA